MTTILDSLLRSYARGTVHENRVVWRVAVINQTAIIVTYGDLSEEVVYG